MSKKFRPLAVACLALLTAGLFFSRLSGPRSPTAAPTPVSTAATPPAVATGDPTPTPRPAQAPQISPAAASSASRRMPRLADEQRRTLDRLPASPLRTALLRLDPPARERALFHLARLQLPAVDIPNLRVSPDGALYVLCPVDQPAPPPPVDAPLVWRSEQPLLADLPAAAALPGTETSAAAVPSSPGTLAASVPISAPPLRHSRPGAPNLLVLDFSGGNLGETRWTDGTTVVFDPVPFDTDGDRSTFSASEQADIIAIWQRVAEHFSPFDVDVTTERPAVYPARSARVMVTRVRDANNLFLPGNSSTSAVGGIAYLGYFGTAGDGRWGSTAFVYYDMLGTPANCAVAASHEFGHTLGLTHQGTSTSPYYSGHGSGTMRWAPLMGSAYGAAFAQWAKGDYHDANNTQDAMALLGQRLGYRPPSASSTPSGSSGTTFSDVTTIAQPGVIFGANSKNYYFFNVVGGTVQLAVQGFATTSGLTGGASGYWKLELFEAASLLRVAVSEFPAGADASLSCAVPRAGIYYAVVSASASYSPTAGTGPGTPFDPNPQTRANFTAYGSAGQYLLTGTVAPSRPFHYGANLNGRIGVPFSFPIRFSNAPTSFTAADLPPGLTIDPIAGVIRGTPTAAGNFTSSVTATNALGSNLAIYGIQIREPLPTITGLSGTQRLAFGASATLAVDATSFDDTLSYQWFRNGQAIAGATARTYPITNFTIAQEGWYQVKVTNRAGTVPSRAVFVVATPASTVFSAWGLNDEGQANVPPGTNDLVAIGVGVYHTLGLRANGTVIAWGSNVAGQSRVPADLTDVVAVRGSYYNSLALKGDGTVVAWGWTGSGLNVVPTGLKDVVALDAGSAHAIALRADGSVVVWAELGHPTLAIPSAITTFGASAIAAGLEHCVAIAQTGGGYPVGWGDNTYKQCDLPAGFIPNYPVFLSAGYATTYLLRADGSYTGWGGGSPLQYYPYWSYDAYTAYSIPNGTTGLRVVAGGWRHSLGLKHDGTVLAIGLHGNADKPATLQQAFHIATKFESSFALSDSTGYSAPTITQQPAAMLTTAGGSAVFRVVASGTPTPLFQWRRNGVNLPGATSAELTLTAITAAQTGDYDVVVTNAAGQVTSTAAALRFTQSVSFPTINGLSFPRATPVTLGGTSSSGLPISYTVLSGPATVSSDQLTLTGAGTVAVRATQPGDSTYSSAFADQTFTVLGGFAAWQVSAFSPAQLADASISGELANPDGDDFSNLAEYALGLSPLTADPTLAGPTAGWDGANWTYTWRRPSDRSDLTYTVETSGDLASWTAVTATPTLVTTTGGIDTWRVTVPPGTARKQFLRLVIRN